MYTSTKYIENLLQNVQEKGVPSSVAAKFGVNEQTLKELHEWMTQEDTLEAISAKLKRISRQKAAASTLIKKALAHLEKLSLYLSALQARFSVRVCLYLPLACACDYYAPLKFQLVLLPDSLQLPLEVPTELHALFMRALKIGKSERAEMLIAYGGNFNALLDYYRSQVVAYLPSATSDFYIQQNSTPLADRETFSAFGFTLDIDKLVHLLVSYSVAQVLWATTLFYSVIPLLSSKLLHVQYVHYMYSYAIVQRVFSRDNVVVSRECSNRMCWSASPSRHSALQSEHVSN